MVGTLLVFPHRITVLLLAHLWADLEECRRRGEQQQHFMVVARLLSLVATAQQSALPHTALDQLGGTGSRMEAVSRDRESLCMHSSQSLWLPLAPLPLS